MQSPNLGPDWFWKLLFFLAGFGAVIGIVGVIRVIIWLCKHLKLV